MNRITNVHKPVVEDTEEKAEDKKKEEEEEEEKSSGARALPSTFRKGKEAVQADKADRPSRRKKKEGNGLCREAVASHKELPSSWTFY